MSAPIDSFNINSEEWYTVSTMEPLSDNDSYLDGHALIEDFKISDSLMTNDDSMQTMTHENINAADLVIANSERRGPPERNNIETPFKFTVEINSNDTNKKKYLYSHRLNRIYVDMECDFSVQFNWEGALAAALWVRACVVFADDAQAQKRPVCCLQHLHQRNTDVDKHIGLNVLHSSRPMGTVGVEYRGVADAPDSWLSTVVALNKTGPQPVAHAYKFVCKSSCSSGINRRAIAIIFTLEDANGVVYGRQMVGARVCACPRRDMMKDEESEGVFKSGKKRVSSNMTQPKQKKIKLEVADSESTPVANPDERVISITNIEFIGGSATATGLRVIQKMMEQTLASKSNSLPTAMYEERLAKIKQVIRDIKGKPDN